MKRKRLTEEQYNAMPGVRRSDLWKMNECPEKYLWNTEHPMETTPALTFGIAAHKMMLQEKTFFDDFAVAPVVDRRTKARKEEYETFCAANAGKTIISREDFNTICNMSVHMTWNSLAKELLTGKGETEVSYFWKDPETGEKCKARCDRVVNLDVRTYVVDYKTTRSADTRRFNSEIFKFGYHVQAAMYAEGVQKVNKLDELPGFIFVAQEKDEPYSINVIEVSPEVMEYGSRIYHELLGKLHECKELDVWPGYMEDGMMNETYLPGWVEFDDEE